TEVAGAARASETQMSGEVSLTTVEGFLPYLVGPIATLTAKHPGLRIALHLADTGPSVRNREVDVAIGVMPRPPAGCWGRRALRIRYGVFGTKEALARRPGPRWIVTGATLRHTPEAEWERTHAHDVAASGSRTAMIALLRRGVGIALVPRVMALPHPELAEAKAHRASIGHLERVAWVLAHPDARKSPRVVALMKALTKELAAIQR
ncbi:MAG: substrate-binding domain-containing protein, partial [Myxococcota bacterium]|nr:substrate-binding domain-containing protein [Myxococcota bacterium]